MKNNDGDRTLAYHRCYDRKLWTSLLCAELYGCCIMTTMEVILSNNQRLSEASHSLAGQRLIGSMIGYKNRIPEEVSSKDAEGLDSL